MSHAIANTHSVPGQWQWLGSIFSVCYINHRGLSSEQVGGTVIQVLHHCCSSDIQFTITQYCTHGGVILLSWLLLQKLQSVRWVDVVAWRFCCHFHECYQATHYTCIEYLMSVVGRVVVSVSNVSVLRRSQGVFSNVSVSSRYRHSKVSVSSWSRRSNVSVSRLLHLGLVSVSSSYVSFT